VAKVLAIFLVRTELDKGTIFVEPSRMSWRQIEYVARSNQFFRAIAIPNMDAPCEEIAPVGTVAKIIGESFQQRPKVGSRRKYHIGN